MSDENINHQSERDHQDSKEFRESSIARVTELLNNSLKMLRIFKESGDTDHLLILIAGIDDLINRKMLNIGKETDIYPIEDTAIKFMIGVIVWKRPADVYRLFETATRELIKKVSADNDWERLAKGLYFVEILLHKFSNGNGRTARALKLLCEKIGSGDTSISEQEVRTVLGLDLEAISKTGNTTYRFNTHPDLENFQLGVAYFALHKGLSYEQVTETLKINHQLPENGLESLAKHFHQSIQELKVEFIHFMAIDSDLDFCTFPI